MATTTMGEKASSAGKARSIAVTQLIELHKEDFTRIHGDVRESYGLTRAPMTPGEDTPDVLRAKIARVEAKRAKWEAKLAAFGLTANGDGGAA
jgi:hypothetical protein